MLFGTFIDNKMQLFDHSPYWLSKESVWTRREQAWKNEQWIFICFRFIIISKNITTTNWKGIERYIKEWFQNDPIISSSPYVVPASFEFKYVVSQPFLTCNVTILLYRFITVITWSLKIHYNLVIQPGGVTSRFFLYFFS